MMASLKKLTAILRSDDGIISVEYGLILSGVTALALVVVAELAGDAGSVATRIKDVFEAGEAQLNAILDAN